MKAASIKHAESAQKPADTSRSRLFAISEHGSTLVESALGLTVFFTGLFGVLEISRAVYLEHFVTDAAVEASRYAMVRGSSWSGVNCAAATTKSCNATSANVGAFVESIVPPGVDPSQVQTSVVWAGTSPSGAACLATNGANSPGCTVAVTVKYSFALTIPLVPLPQFNLQSTSAVTVQQ